MFQYNKFKTTRSIFSTIFEDQKVSHDENNSDQTKNVILVTKKMFFKKKLK